MNEYTQITKIIDYCLKFTWITQRDALRLGIYRLASRMSDMKTAGFVIKSEYIKVKNIDGTESRVKRYAILKYPDGRDFKTNGGDYYYAENVSV